MVCTPNEGTAATRKFARWDRFRTSATRSQIVASAFGSLHNWLVQVVQSTKNLRFCHRLLYNLKHQLVLFIYISLRSQHVVIKALPNIIEIDRYFYAYHDCQEDSRLSPDQLLFTNRRLGHLFINFLFESEKRTRSPSNNIFNWRTNLLQSRLPKPSLSTSFPMIVCQ